MGIEDIANVSVTKATGTIAKVGYGVPMLVGYHTHWLDRVRTYTSLTGMVADGFATTDPLYIMASRVFAQTPKPKKIKIGRRVGAPVQSIRISPLDTTVGLHYQFNVVAPGGVTTAIDVVGDATPTTAELATALAAAIDALAGVAAVVASTVNVDITCTSAGQLAYLTGLPARSVLKVDDRTPDPATGIATDLAAIQLADGDWYGLAIDSCSNAEQAAAAAWAESNEKLFCPSTSDSACADSGSTTDLAYVLNAAAYARTALWYEQRSTQAYLGCAVMGRMLATVPGKATWAEKKVNGVSHSAVTDTEGTNLEAKACNYLKDAASVSFTWKGVTSAEEWIDITVGSDSLRTDMQERIFLAKTNRDKIGFDDAGIAVVVAEVNAALQQKVRDDFIEPGFTITVPKASEISATDKANRELNGIEFDAPLTGAIHVSNITGRVAY